jgi:phosphatidylserine decarboxylase
MINRIFKENIILFSGELILLVSFCILWIVTRNTVFLLTGICILVSGALTVSFLRDPDRRIPEETGVVLSPADGKIIRITRHQDEAKNPDYTVAIYLRLWDVHINRIPISGTVELCRYRRGKFRPAFFREAASNEQMVLVISDAEDRFILKQIAGILARRIVCRVIPGNRVKQGDRFGLIKLGSRVELTIPAKYGITVRLNQKVKAGETILARLYGK